MRKYQQECISVVDLLQPADSLDDGCCGANKSLDRLKSYSLSRTKGFFVVNVSENHSD